MMMKASLITGNELHYLLETLNEIKDNGESLELDNAIEMVQGFIDESHTVDAQQLENWLEENQNLLEKMYDEEEGLHV